MWHHLLIPIDLGVEGGNLPTGIDGMMFFPQVYPTATRALGLGTCSGMARVGALITPFIAQVNPFSSETGGLD